MSNGKSNDEEVLEKVTSFAAKAHAGQIRRYAREPYIEHPKRVMRLCAKYSSNLPLLSAALLHDVLEDTDTTSVELRAFLLSLMIPELAEQTLSVVLELTDVYTKEKYPKLNRRTRKSREHERLASASPSAHTVKYSDVIDNSKDVVNEDPDFAKVFLLEYRAMLKLLNKGNPELYKLAKEAVEQNLEKLSAGRS